MITVLKPLLLATESGEDARNLQRLEPQPASRGGDVDWLSIDHALAIAADDEMVIASLKTEVERSINSDLSAEMQRNTAQIEGMRGFAERVRAELAEKGLMSQEQRRKPRNISGAGQPWLREDGYK